MEHLQAYAQVGGNALIKAQCDVCGKKYGTKEEAVLCEDFHRLHSKEEEYRMFKGLRLELEKAAIGIDTSSTKDVTTFNGEIV